MTELEKKDWIADLMYELVQDLNRWDKEEIVTVCKKENKNENDRIRNKVEDLMYDLYDGLNNMMVLTSGMGITCET